MTSISFDRQRNIVNPDKAAQTHVNVLGLGTVGSNAAVQLAKLGITSFTLIDFDEVEPHNLPSQDFEAANVGSLKAHACANRLRAINPNVRIKIQVRPLEGYEMLDPGVVILAVDSITMRRKLLEGSIKFKMHDLMVDTRMNANNMQMWSIDPCVSEEVDRYRNTLHDASQNVQAPCGGRTFAPVGAMSGAMVAQMVTRLLRDEKPPFYTYLDMDSFTLATA